MNQPVQQHIAAKASTDTLKRLAHEQGMRTMRGDGLIKVQHGQTTLEELDRVVPPELPAA